MKIRDKLIKTWTSVVKTQCEDTIIVHVRCYNIMGVKSTYPGGEYYGIWIC